MTRDQDGSVRNKHRADASAEGVRSLVPPQYLTTEDVAERWRTTPKGVAELRYRGQGPRGYRIGRRILYRIEDVEAWEASRADPQPVA
jgi:Helix-turn-helix domain